LQLDRPHSSAGPGIFSPSPIAPPTIPSLILQSSASALTVPESKKTIKTSSFPFRKKIQLSSERKFTIVLFFREKIQASFLFFPSPRERKRRGQ
jgi:hypothetical protein